MSAITKCPFSPTYRDLQLAWYRGWMDATWPIYKAARAKGADEDCSLLMRAAADVGSHIKGGVTRGPLVDAIESIGIELYQKWNNKKL